MHQDRTLWCVNLSKAKRPKAKPKKLVLGDDAIESCETDWFDFETPATELTKQLYEISKSSGICCGIIGSWGSGKSSFMKLMVEYVRKKYSKKACVAWFTAWDPGGMEDLGDAMLYRLFSSIVAEHSDLSGVFKELQEALGIRKSIRERARQALGVVSKAGAVVSDVARVADVASGLLHEFEAPRKVQESFAKLVEWLDKKDMTIFFFVDDVDRTGGEQIRDVLSELKVYVSKPRIIAVLGYDEDYVLSALKPVLPQGIEPKRYLEKIVTHKKNLPAPTGAQLVAYTCDLLTSLIALKPTYATELGVSITRLALHNPRRVKSIVLNYADSLKQIPDHVEWPLYVLESFLITSVAASIGLLSDEDLRRNLMEGNVSEIISDMKRLADRNPARSEEINALANEIDTIGPEFSGHTPAFLRLLTSVEDLERQETDLEPPEKQYDWKISLLPILSNTVVQGLELPSDIAYSSCRVAAPASVKMTEKLDKLLRDRMRRLAAGMVCRLSWDTAEMLVVLSSFARNARHLALALDDVYDHSAELVANKGLAIWVIDDGNVFSRRHHEHYIKGARARSKGLKNPLIYQYTPASKVSALLNFLLKTARKKEHKAKHS